MYAMRHGARMMLLGVVVAMTLRGQCLARVLVDDFSLGAINSAIWKSEGLGLGVSILQTSQQVLMEVNSNAGPSTFIAGYRSVPALRGDFDIQIDYSLVTWPSQSGIRLGLGVLVVGADPLNIPAGAGIAASVQRVSFGPGELSNLPRDAYATDFDQGAILAKSTTDQSGTLRLVRTGNIVTGYYLQASTWVTTGSYTWPTEDVTYSFEVWGGDTFTNQNVNVSVGNFIVNQGQLVFLPRCNGDGNGDGRVAVDEIIDAVNNDLHGCPVWPSSAQ